MTRHAFSAFEQRCVRRQAELHGADDDIDPTARVLFGALRPVGRHHEAPVMRINTGMPGMCSLV